MPAIIDDETLRNYLADALPPGESARVEKALRESAELRARLEDVRAQRSEAHVHTLGAIWRRQRLTCATRQQLGSYLLDALDPDHAAYFRFHIDVVECQFCQANLADLQSKAAQATQAVASRHSRFFEGSRHLLGGES